MLDRHLFLSDLSGNQLFLLLQKCRPHVCMSKFNTERLQRQNPSCFEHSSIQLSPVSQQINASVSKERSLLLFHCAKIWVQEVTPSCVPVWDKSDIPTKPFPRINKQNLPTISVHTSTRGLLSSLKKVCVVVVSADT